MTEFNTSSVIDTTDQRELCRAIESVLPRSLSGGQREQLRTFIPAYLDGAAQNEISDLPVEELAGIVLSHWQLAKPALEQSYRYRVYSPGSDLHGWQSMHTIIQLVATDQPWLVSSMQAALDRAGHVIHRLIHPVVLAQRDDEGVLTGLSENAAEHSGMESLIHIEIDAVEKDQHQAIHSLIDHLFTTLRMVRTQSQALRERLANMANSIDNVELAAFLHWLDEDQFACLGAARLLTSDNFTTLHDCAGILSSGSQTALLPSGLDPHQLAQHLAHEPLVVSKASQRSPIIRNEMADLIVHVICDAQGNVKQLDCVLGILVSGLQNEAVSNIPWMRERVERVIQASGASAESHAGKAIASTLRGLPRSMLMQTHSNDLLTMASGIVALQERQQVRLFSSNDALGRFSNCLVYIPRDAYNRDLRLLIEQILVTHSDGMCASFDTRFSSESALARLHFVIEKKPPYNRTIDWLAIEQRIKQAAVSWNDKLEHSLRDSFDELKAMQWLNRYANAFSSAYREDYSARVATADINFIENHLAESAPVMSFYRRIIADSDIVNFKLFAHHQPVSLSDVIPIIENMGLRVESEQPFEIKRRDASIVWVHEFTVTHTGTEHSSQTEDTAERIQSAFDHIWHGDVENDGFNRLILAASLDWRQVVVIRALCKYLLQINVPFSQEYMINSLLANASITKNLIALFEQRFMPRQPSQNAQAPNLTIHKTSAASSSSIPAIADTNNPGQLTDQQNIERQKALLNTIDEQLEQVSSLDEDRILRSYRNLILATLRTNAFRESSAGELRDFLSFKFDSSAIPDLPLPRPKFEVFVYSSKVEGIHLRGGSVARGGLRWSDRREDYRTEVLGLMKAQMVKNAVIVPVGSKGGFYVKAALPAEREAMMSVVVDCYRTFLSGLLDITDNLDAATVIAPENVVRYDSDDPYLVVAADKGTATFSDYANEVAVQYGFWLGDAFASGGSVGYDHKKMGITARGAWESVKRHFRNLGIDTQTQSFTAVGIGDMAGDVFGNGMLLSSELKLVAAFNHMHIFIDPDPDTAASFAERQRLFQLSRSSWEDYNHELISEGGGIFSRSSKQIELSQQAMQVLGTDQQKLTPTELITIILKAPVDLLWNGGIGTYVKARSQTHADAADRANDSLRINGDELRARVVGEGGNLGFTQLGRIDFAHNGGLIYTDAIDNSAGVDCSDHEVNIKILANALVANQDMTVKQRDQLLESMTDDVAKLVLKDNYLQSQCIDLSVVDGAAALSDQSRFMQHLESIDRLDREIEYLPDAEEIAERLAADRSLSRPEIAVLVSYSKMVMFDDLMASDFTNDAALESILCDYFPQALNSAFREQILTHRLRAEIIATLVTNDVINRLGPTFVFRMHQELNANAPDVAAAFVIVARVFKLPKLWADIEALDNQIDALEQYRMHILVRGLVERSVHWLIRNRKTDSNIEEQVERYQTAMSKLIEALPQCLTEPETTTLSQRVKYFTETGVNAETAMQVAQVVPLSSSLDIIEIARSIEQPVDSVAGVYFALGQHLDLSWLRERIGSLVANSHWHKMATSELRSDLHYQQRYLCAEVACATDISMPAIDRVERWSSKNTLATNKYKALITDMKGSPTTDFAMLSLAINEVHKLLRSDRPLAS